MKRTDFTKTGAPVRALARNASRWFAGGAVVLSLVAVCRIVPAAGLVVLDNRPLVVDAAANTASGWLLLQNTSTNSTNFMLTAGNFVSLTTSQALTARISLQTSGAPYLAVVGLAPTSTLTVRVEVANFLEGGEATAPLLANGGSLGMLRAERAGAPFNVTLDGTPAEKPELVVEYHADTAFYLRNADAMPYRVRWELEVAGWLVTNGTALVTASSTVRVPFQARRGFFHPWNPCTWMKDELKEGRLIVRWDDPGGKVMREKPLALRARIKHVGDGLHAVGIVLLLIVLGLGAVCSLGLNNGIPNQLKRLDLREELDVLSKRIHDLTPQIDSAVRVLLRVERSRLAKLLDGRWAISPELVNVFKTVGAGVATLKRQLDVLERMDSVHDEIETLRGSVVPPTLLEQVLRRLEQACKLIHASAPPESDLVAAQTLVAEAATWLANIEKPNEVLALILAKRVKELRRFFTADRLKEPPVARFKERLANLFEILDRAEYETPANITPDIYARLDARTRRLELVAEYLELGKNKMAGEEATTYDSYFEWLISALRREGLAPLEHAQQLVRHLQEGIFPGQLIRAIQAGQTKIEADLAFPRTNDAIQFRVVFNNAAYNDATARQSLTCQWNFGDDLTEKGWVVSHYFRDARAYHVKTTFFHKEETLAGPTALIKVHSPTASARTMAKSSAAPETPVVATSAAAASSGGGTGGAKAETPAKRCWWELDGERLAPVVERAKLSPRARIELLRVGIALFAALLALYGTAREQFAQLECLPGLVAVFLAGFGADTIKNLLTQKP